MTTVAGSGFRSAGKSALNGLGCIANTSSGRPVQRGESLRSSNPGVKGGWCVGAAMAILRALVAPDEARKRAEALRYRLELRAAQVVRAAEDSGDQSVLIAIRTLVNQIS